MNRDNSSIESPFNFKKIGVFIVNIVLFGVYYLILSFIFGFFLGLFEAFGSIQVSEKLISNIALFAFIVTIVLTIFLRKKIYIRVAKKAQMQEPNIQS